MNKPTVSVCMLTYNHAKYLEEAINGILFQKTIFKIELVISNDNSSDDTNSIIEKIINKNNSNIVIRYFNQKENLGMMENFIFTLKQCKGEYIALCEGDDYWTDPLKVQKQIEFMKSNNQLSFTFHRAEILHNGILELNYKNKAYNDRGTISTDSFLMKAGARFCTASAIFKSEILNPFPDWLIKCHVGDFPLMFLALENGKIGYLKDVMCVYRFQSEGSWSEANLMFKNRILNIKKMIHINRLINENTNGKYKKYLKTNILSYLVYKVLVTFRN
uniref:glycosyltransferase n=1 Tax=Flavobacterium sp. TaxID=239 RepID=UPI004049BF3C